MTDFFQLLRPKTRDFEKKGLLSPLKTTSSTPKLFSEKRRPIFLNSKPGDSPAVSRKWSFQIFRHIKSMGANLPLNSAIFEGFFIRCLPITLTPTSAILFTYEGENILPANYNKFAVECDWNKKNSQNVQILGFSRKKIEIFIKSFIWQILSRVRLKRFFSQICLSTLFLRFFLAKCRKNLSLEKLENLKKQNISKNNAFIFVKDILTMLEGAKYLGGSRVSC